MNRKQAVVQTQDYIKLENEYGAMNYKPLDGTKTQRRKKEFLCEFAPWRLCI
jgi:hypothetical protein